MASSFDRLKELNLSRDEVNRIGEALKKEEFRKLLADYVEEIQDPRNRQLYEDEVREIEKERGQEVTFLHPTPCYVIKTSVNGNQKGFINICSNENINKPSSLPTVKNGTKGLQWSLPHSLSPPHEDIDNKGAHCKVYDVLFHPDTVHLASKNKDFRSMVNNVALNAVENNFNVSLDKKNLKFPKMNYKGVKRASIIRKPSNEKPTEKSAEEQEIFDKIYSEIDSTRTKQPQKNRSKISSKISKKENNSSYTTPTYIIKHRSHIDMQEFTEHKTAKLNVATPKELIVEINLPLLKSSGDMDVDVTEKTIQLISEKPAKYKLNLTLPYHVNEASGIAKFDKDLKKLVITLPVKQKNAFELLKYDSGVDSCMESDLNSPASLESDDDDVGDEEANVIETHHQQVGEVKTGSGDVKAENSDHFLNSSELYNLPDFICNVFDNMIAFTFNVRNVDENTVVKKCSAEDSLIKVKFSSVSSSFYPCYYSFYVKFPKNQFEGEEVTIETWDNNVILQIPLKHSTDKLESYLYGSNEDDLVEKFIEQPSVINQVLQQSEFPIDSEKLEFIKVDREQNCENNNSSDKQAPVKLNDSNRENERKEAEIEQEEYTEDIKPLPSAIKPIIKYKSRAIDIIGTSYESSGDELSVSSFSPRKSKGILKRMSDRRSKFGRSISESSLDDFLCSSLENYHGSFEGVTEESREDDSTDGMSSSLKKSVRFNDVVYKQLFRSNSSILGQKKKNQRKTRNKKRAHERRYSESEASDIESKKEGDNQTANSVLDREPVSKMPQDTATDKKEDNDIFHLEMNN